MRIFSFVVGVCAALMVGVALISDEVTLQGERTVYIVECRQGSWEGLRCSGRLVATDRVRFRVLKAHREVLFWTAGSPGPSGKLTDCDIQDGRDWVCSANADGPSPIAHKMVLGRPVVDAGHAAPIHAVTKMRWWLLRWAIPLGSQADF